MRRWKTKASTKATALKNSTPLIQMRNSDSSSKQRALNIPALKGLKYRYPTPAINSLTMDFVPYPPQMEVDYHKRDKKIAFYDKILQFRCRIRMGRAGEVTWKLTYKDKVKIIRKNSTESLNTEIWRKDSLDRCLPEVLSVVNVFIDENAEGMKATCFIYPNVTEDTVCESADSIFCVDSDLFDIESYSHFCGPVGGLGNAKTHRDSRQSLVSNISGKTLNRLIHSEGKSRLEKPKRLNHSKGNSRLEKPKRLNHSEGKSRLEKPKRLNHSEGKSRLEKPKRPNNSEGKSRLVTKIGLIHSEGKRQLKKHEISFVYSEE
ncbi:hypothetical protein PoB_005644200 [Plakobranchus ocellatus]|uniref:Uncharacterized protein n=1 Tax=Plakobranchus ocellatus TaxID=259542 RepID=A0AAV4CEF8_9GAST|nr:hypothetical protein PoB_005644200 [Plakobranchus ocellatus]